LLPVARTPSLDSATHVHSRACVPGTICSGCCSLRSQNVRLRSCPTVTMGTDAPSGSAEASAYEDPCGFTTERSSKAEFKGVVS